MKGIIRLLYILLGICLHQNIISQELRFDHINLPDEISSRTANCFLEDKNGEIWIGLRHGLARYDGYRAEVVESVNEAGEITGFGHVVSLLEDMNGQIWVGTMNGLFIYNPINNTVVPFLNHKLSKSHCRSLYLTRHQEVVIGTDHGVHIYSPVSNQLQAYVHHASLGNGLSHNIIRCIYEDVQNNLWIGTYDGLNKIDRKRNVVQNYRFSPEGKKPKKNNLILSITSLSHNSDSVLLVGTETGICVFNRQTENYRLFTRDDSSGLTNNVIKTSCVITPYQVLLGTDWGLNVFNLNDYSFERYFHDFENQFTISNNVINALLKDSKGNVWLGTNNGIDKMYISKNKFYYNQVADNSAVLKGGVTVQSFSQNALGDVWMATNEGCVWYNKKQNKYHFFKPPELLHNKVNEVIVDAIGLVWIATAGGLNVYNPAIDEMSSYTSGADGRNNLETNYINCISQDVEGNIWLGTYGKGLYKVNTKAGGGLEFISLNINIIDDDDSSPKSVFDIVDDGNKLLWIATDKGIIRFNQVTGEYTNFIGKEQDHGHVPGAFVSQIVHDGKDLWTVCSEGVSKWDYETEKFSRLSDLPANVRNISLVDNQLWLTTYSSLYRYVLESKELVKLPTKEIGIRAFSKGMYNDGEGNIYLGGYEGFVKFNPTDISVDTLVPPVVFTGFNILGTTIYPNQKYNNRFIIDKHINYTPSIVLKYEENTFGIAFSSLLYDDNNHGSYEYILEGYDSHWQRTSAEQNQAVYTRVKPGKYEFKVKAANSYGLYGDGYRSIDITIKPPLWASDWAIVFYVIVFISLFIISRRLMIARIHYRNDLRFAKLQKEKSDELIQVKTRFFTNISHELKTPLTLISNPVEKLLVEEKDPSKIKMLKIIERNTNRLIKLVNQVLDMRKIERGIETLCVQEYDIVAFCYHIFEQYTLVASERNIKMLFHSEPDELVTSFDLEKMEKIINNLLSNAYKFTPNNGRIDVEVTLEEHQTEKESKPFVYIRVNDSGTGIAPQDIPKVFDRFNNVKAENYTSQEGTGIGLSLVRDYIELHDGFAKAESKLNQGSVFTVGFPISTEHMTEPGNDSAYESETLEEMQHHDSVADDMVEDDKETILVVEDDSDMRLFITNLFEEAFQVITAVDGVEGWRQAVKNTPDLIISDVMMPNMDGISLCEKIKTDLRTSHIPIILLTARDSLESKMAGIATGADDYVSKPFNNEYLLLRAAKLIEQRKKLQKALVGQMTIEPSEVTVSSLDEKFLKELVMKIEGEIDNSELNVKHLSELMHMSHTNLYRKIKGMTGQTATEFIRTIRLKRAAQLLKNEHLNVTDVMYMVGFTHRSYFTRSFKDLFGVSPKDYNK